MHLGSGMIRLWDDSLPLARIASAVKDCGWIDLDNVPLMVANTLISSWDRLFAGTSKLAVENLCHSAKDIGLWGIFFMSDQLNSWGLDANLRGHWSPDLVRQPPDPAARAEAPTPKAGAGP
ncbi:hypothetical protein pipiens_016142 [Culex pipiens pipiens]|uniref:Uncharacterized protein n=1 Tax=Culex pipiens pipiens TaxID=38569 RepID=A0ABD1CMI3_CULPP